MTGILSVTKSVLGDNPAMLKFAAWFIVWMMSSIICLPASIPSFFSFRMKLQSHKLMLDQIASFDVRAAECTLPADREAIEEQVKELFCNNEILAENHPADLVDYGEVRLQRFAQPDMGYGDPLDRFNEYIRGTLGALVMDEIGDELYVSWQTCLAAFLPMIFYSSVNILGCDNGPCSESARLEGYSSVGQYMAVQTVGWTLCILIAFPLTYPTLLRMIKFVLSYGDGALPMSAAFLCCPLAY
ncbi:unnamed protein product, partial [Symbiodinium pilosum]